MTAEDRKALAEELLRKTIGAKKTLAELEAIKGRLKKASESDGSFTVRVNDLGQVEVAAPRARRFKGTMPTLVPDLYLAMTAAEKSALDAAGVVVVAEQWSRPFAGSVTVKID